MNPLLILLFFATCVMHAAELNLEEVPGKS
jgi:hypothetical protein